MKFRKAKASDADEIWEIIQFAIQSRKEDGSTQWQDGYPNEQTITKDLQNGYGHVMTDQDQIMMYAAIQSDSEPSYEHIDGQWLTQSPYLVIHRMAVSPDAKGKGMAKRLLKKAEGLAQHNNISSIRIDTHEDNHAMLHILDTLGYTYCGEIYVRGDARKAFEKVLVKN